MNERLVVYLNYLDQDTEISSKLWFHLDVLLKQILSAEILPIHPQAWSERTFKKENHSVLLNFASLNASKDVNFLSKIDSFIKYLEDSDSQLKPENLIYNFLIDQPSIDYLDRPNLKNYHVSDKETLEGSADQDLNQMNWIHLTDCAYSIKRVWQNFQNDKVGSSKGTIYLATVDEDLSQSKKTLRLELESMGFEVLSNEDHLTDQSGNLNYDIEKIQRCDFSIHMIGAGYGKVNVGKNISYAESELNHALKIDKQNFRVFIWAPPYLNIQDIRQKSFFESLKREADQLDQVEMIVSSLEYFKILLGDLLISTQSKAEMSATTGNILNENLIYLIYEEIDQTEAFKLKSQLIKAGCHVIEPAFDKINNQRIHHHYQTINQCESAIIFAGKVSRNWVKMKMMDLVKAPGFGSDSQLKKKFVVCTGAFDEFEFDVHHNFSIEENFDPQHVSSLVERLRSY